MALWENVIGYGLHADRPAAGSPGAVYFESDTGIGYRDNGTSWDAITGTPQPVWTLVHVSVNTVLSAGQTLVDALTVGVDVTLPDPTLNGGTAIMFVAGVAFDSFDFLHLKNFDTTEWGDIHPPYTIACNGTAWLNADF